MVLEAWFSCRIYLIDEGVKFGDLADHLLFTTTEGGFFLHHSDLEPAAFSLAEEGAQLILGLAMQANFLSFGCAHKGCIALQCAISAAKEGIIDLLAVLSGQQHLHLGIILLGKAHIFIPDLADLHQIFTW